VNAEYLVGDPADTLMELATKWGADLIVVGSQGRSAIGRLILGSVSRRIVTEARCSVRIEETISDYISQVRALALVFPWIYFIGGGNARSGICCDIVCPCRR
jgi:hypothetical protein